MDARALENIVRYLRPTARSILIIFSSFWFIFALVSGSEGFGGGIKGILINSPNAIPWLILFGFVYVAWRWEHIGAALLTLMAVFTILFFRTYADIVVFFIISVPLLLLAAAFLFCWYVDGKHKDRVKKKGKKKGKR